MTNLWITPVDLGAAYENSEFADEACRVASNILWAMSGRKYSGTTTVTERYYTVINSFRYQGGSAKDFYPHMVGGRIFNVPTEDWNDSAYQSDGSSSLSRIKLRGKPVQKVHLVRSGHDGTIIPEDKYYVAEHSTLIAYKGVPWPPGNIEVTYTYGSQPPAAGRAAARSFAQQLINSWNGDSCRLPDRITSVTRQGVSYTVLDSQDFLENLRTGIYEIDLFLKTANPAKALAPAKVFSPDMHRARRAAPPKPLPLQVSAAFDVALSKATNWTENQIHACTGPYAWIGTYNTPEWKLELTGYSYAGSNSVIYPESAATFSVVGGVVTVNLSFDYRNTVSAIGLMDPGYWELRARNVNTGATVDLLQGNLQVIKVISGDITPLSPAYEAPTTFTCLQGSTFSKTLRWTDGGYPINLTGYTAAMQVKSSYGSATSIITLSTANGRITIANPTNGELVLTISSEDTADLPTGEYLFDIEVTSLSGTVTRLVQGPFIVLPEVTTV